ncbi:hypothetical protein IV203_025875 [Nitzschia inconspicua]|uniref:Uncharacterized protein n=1 Tax=Nitzschia inconspicua TaxID=303405 RepID=A0A9K3LGX8_9STRA|nr:hypothetical protein IV203_025875 [Nitzschia inconspicua]
MLDAIVQFLRNALCCVKDLHWFPDSVIHKEYGAYEYLFKGYVTIPEPLDKISLLEFIISWTQLYAFLSTTFAGIQLTWKSVGKLRRIVRLMESRLDKNDKNTKKDDDKKSIEATANRLVNESLMQQAKAAIRGVVVGILVTPIGIAFFWLFSNSWHVTETPWIGGLLGLIDALTVMELCLLPLLGYMLVDARDYFGKVRDTKKCIQAVESKEILSSTDSITLTNYELMHPEWVPFWEGGVSPLASPMTPSEETKSIDKEIATVQNNLSKLFIKEEKDKKDDNEKEQKIRQETLEKSVQTMKASLYELNVKGYRELVYFVLNFIAFYGYLMGITAFYFPDDEAQPTYVRHMKFGYGNAIADWTGNFAGDLMWTIEPLVILGSPLYLTYVQRSSKRTNSTPVTAAEKAKTE